MRGAMKRVSALTGEVAAVLRKDKHFTLMPWVDGTMFRFPVFMAQWWRFSVHVIVFLFCPQIQKQRGSLLASLSFAEHCPHSLTLC